MSRYKDAILNIIIFEANKHYKNSSIDENSIEHICETVKKTRIVDNFDINYKNKILQEVIYRSKNVIGGYPIDINILEDICDAIKVDKNI